MTRREAREAAFALIYEREFRKDDTPGKIYEDALRIRELEDNEYVRNTFFGVFEKIAEIDAKIAGASEGWHVERMSRVTISIMRLCVYELFYEKTIPINVSLNEAVELAKKYDTDEAPAFVNGVLNRISKDPEIVKILYPQKKKS